MLLGCGSFHPGQRRQPEHPGVLRQDDPGQDASRPLQTGLTDPDGANKLWAEVDHDVTDQAPWAPMFNPKQIDFLSKRVTGYQFSPQWYILIAQASVQ